MKNSDDLPEPRLIAAVKRVQLMLRTTIDKALRISGLSMAQATVLQALAEAGPSSCADLARRCSITRQSMQDVVGSLHTRGFIEKRPHPEDQRHILVTSTSSGRKAARAAQAVIEGIEQRMTRGLEIQQQSALLSYLGTCAGNLSDTLARDAEPSNHRQGRPRPST